ncbi:hypothetical protein RHGRI_025443 [Rhododendron griersonianum]|uniref:BHLH domain-containing protein n=1 Tax=Rhododendron griersonianum TaxID=479676 RepID=A0AAV6ISR6_9ERIC|nr:hypothetical protein RHGRI_025443 [Rhododendron griersonianum]
MLEHKRSPVSVDQGSLDSFAPKRHKADMSMTSKVSFSLLYFCITLLCFVLLVTLDGDQERKDRIGEKIAALQQLVSPYGKTDTASVLLETMEYITFLHEQVKVWPYPALFRFKISLLFGFNFVGCLRSKLQPSIIQLQVVLCSPYLQSTPAANLQVRI